MAMEKIKASFAQLRLWSAMQLDPDPATYNIPVAIRLPGLWERAKIAQALSDLAKKHEVLRTHFEVQGRRLWQCISEEQELDFEVYRRPETTTLQAQALQTEAQRAFVPDSHRFWRASLWVQESPGEEIFRDPQLMVVVHHLLADGASMAILSRDFLSALDGHAILDPEALGYADLSEWEREHWESEAGRVEIDTYYRKLVASPHAVLAPLIAPRTQSVGGQGPAQRIRLPLCAESQRRLNAYAAKGTTPLMVFLSALWTHLYQSGAGSALCVGTVMAARTRSETQDIVGPVANTTVLPIQLQEQWTRAEVIQATREGVLAGYSEQHIPLEAVIAKLRIPRRANEHPLFDLMFLVQPELDSSLEDMRIELEASRDGAFKSAKFPLSLSWQRRRGQVDVNAGRWELVADIAIERWPGDSGAAFVRQYLETLDAVLLEPNKPLVKPSGVLFATSFPGQSSTGTASPNAASAEGSVAKANELAKPASRMASEEDGENKVGEPEYATALEALLSVLHELIDEPRATAKDDFFEIGGDSIIATQISQRLLSRGYDLPVLEIFDHPRFSTLAGRMRRITPQGETDRPAKIPVQPVDLNVVSKEAKAEGEWREPSPLQKGMLYHSAQQGRGSQRNGVYVQQFCLRFTGTFRAELWQRAWNRVIAQFSTLRSEFVAHCDGQRLRFLAAKAHAMPIRVHRGRLGQEARRERCLQQLRDEGFAETDALLMRCDVWLDGDAGFDWVWSYHHALLDGWSASIVLSQVAREYGRALEAAVEDTYFVPASPAGDSGGLSGDCWPEYLSALASLDHLVQARAIADQCKGYPPLAASASSEDSPAKVSVIEITHRFGKGSSEALQRIAAEHKVTLQASLLAAWALVRSRYAGQHRFCLGMTVSGRDASVLKGLDLRKARGTSTLSLDSMVGVLMNTLPLAIEVAWDKPLKHWIHELMRKQLALAAAAAVPLSEVQKARASKGHAALFEELWVFENYPVAAGLAESLPGLHLESTSIWDASHYALAAVASFNEEVKLRISADAKRYRVEEIRLWLKDMESLLDAWSGPEVWEHRVAWTFASLGEQPKLALPVSRPAPASILGQLETQVRGGQAAQSLAVRDQQGRWSYQQLGRISECWIDELLRIPEAGGTSNPSSDLALNTPPASRVLAIVAPISAPMIAAQLAALRCGWSFVPVSPELPDAQIQARLQEIQASAYVIDPHLDPQSWGVEKNKSLTWPQGFHPDLGSLAEVDQVAGAAGVSEFSDSMTPAHPWLLQAVIGESPAYGILTSGSTGRSKLVSVPHRALAHLVDWHRRVYSINPQTRVAAMASPGFDASIWDIWPVLTAGAQLWLVPAKVRKSPEDLAQWLEEQKIEDCFVPTAIVHRWNRPEPARADRPDLEQGLRGSWPRSQYLKRIRTGGERLLALKTPPACSLINHYGPTEYAVVATSHAVAPVVEDAAALPPIGRGIDRSATYVLSDSMFPVPEGTPGELFLSGPGSALGYQNNPRKTAEQWLPDPYSDKPGARMYRTGDFVVQREGDLHYVDRKDRQVQLQGNRVELGEIEAALRRDPAVSQAAVIVDPANKTLVAFVTPIQDEASLGELRIRMGARLAAVAVPKRWRSLSDLPINDSGKVDYTALRNGIRGETRIYASAQTPIEAILWDLFASLVGKGAWGTKEDFFAIGGDSMSSVQLIARARARGLYLEAGDVEEARSISALAKLHHQREGSGGVRPYSLADRDGTDVLDRSDASQQAARVELCPAVLQRICRDYPWICIRAEASGEDSRQELGVDPETDETKAAAKGSPSGNFYAYRATEIQAGMLFVAQEQALDAKGGTFYVQDLQLEIALPFCAQSFEASFRQLIEEHWVLRVGLVHDAYLGALLVECPPPELEAYLREATVVGDEAGYSEWRTKVGRELSGLETPLLWRNYVQPKSADHFELCCLHHHAILDGWSVSRLLARWFQIYEALRAQKPVPSGPQARYVDYLNFRALQTARDSAAGVHAAGALVDDPRGRCAVENSGQTSMRLAEIIAATDAENAFGYEEQSEVSCDLASDPASDVVSDGASALGEWTLSLPQGLARKLEELAKDPRFSLNTIVFAALAQCLACHARRPEIALAQSYADRNPHIPHVEEIVGLMLRSASMSVAVPEHTPRSQWWEALDREQAEQRMRGIAFRRAPGSSASFDNHRNLRAINNLDSDVLYVFENYPLTLGDHEHLMMRSRTESRFAFSHRTHYALMVAVLPRQDLSLHLQWDRSRFSDPRIAQLAADLVALLTSYAQQPEMEVGRWRPFWLRSSLLQQAPAPTKIKAVAQGIRDEPADLVTDATTDEALASNSQDEQVMIDLWSELLGGVAMEVAVDSESNFVELGGDSVLCMQLVARLREKGLHCTTRDVFESATLADLMQRVRVQGLSPQSLRQNQAQLNSQAGAAQESAAGVLSGVAKNAAEPDSVGPDQSECGQSELHTPVQAWYQAQNQPHPDYFNQSIWVELEQSIAPEVLEAWLATLCRRHPALVVAGQKAEDSWPLRVFELRDESEGMDSSSRSGGSTGRPTEACGDELPAALTREHQSLCHIKGPRCRALYVRGHHCDRLLLVIHHWVVDAVSWRMLVDELSQIAGQSLSAGLARATAMQDPRSPEQGMAKWGQALRGYLRSQAAQAEASFWRRQGLEKDVVELSLGAASGMIFGGSAPREGDRPLVRDACSVESTLPREVAKELERLCTREWKTPIATVIMVALARALAREWGPPELGLDGRKMSRLQSGDVQNPFPGGSERRRFVRLAVEGHGRQAHQLQRVLGSGGAQGISAQLIQEVSLGVGWFTSVSPRLIPIDANDPLGPESRGAYFKKIHGFTQDIPLQGAGFLALKYLGDAQQREQMADCGLGPVSWNYLGRMDLGDAPSRSKETAQPKAPSSRDLTPNSDSASSVDRDSASDPASKRLSSTGHNRVEGAAAKESSPAMVRRILRDPAPSQHPENYRPFALDASGYMQQGELHLNLSYCSRLMSADAVKRVMEHWLSQLRQWSQPELQTSGFDDKLAEVAQILGLELEAEKQS